MTYVGVARRVVSSASAQHTPTPRTTVTARMHAPSSTTRVAAAALGALLFLASCGGGSTPPTTIGFGVTITHSVVVGSSTTGRVDLTRQNYTGDVVLSAEDLPAGMTVSFEPATLSGTASVSRLTIAASGAAAPGQWTITLRAKGAGVQDSMLPFVITVASG